MERSVSLMSPEREAEGVEEEGGLSAGCLTLDTDSQSTAQPLRAMGTLQRGERHPWVEKL